MIKIVVGMLCGVFVGAFAVELLKKKSPQLLERIEREAADLASRTRRRLGDKPVSDSAVPVRGHQA